jgi:tRNA-specific 2-thiouridylase
MRGWSQAGGGDIGCAGAWTRPKTSLIFSRVSLRRSWPVPVSHWGDGPRCKSWRWRREKGFQPLTRQESQDVCFIRDTNYADFLIRTTGINPQSGAIVDTAGHRVGTHSGLHRYTVGQRRGINCPASQAFYVTRIDTRRNRLVVGFKDELVAQSCRVADINWIADIPEGPMVVDTRIRYRHTAVPSTVSPVGHDGAVVRFDQPQAAVTPGQGAVFYRGDEVIGGGWIDA